MFMSLKNQLNSLSVQIKGFFNPESASDIRRLQFFRAGCLIFIILAISYGVIAMLWDQDPVKQPTEPPKPVSTQIATAPSQIDMNEARWSHLEKKLNGLIQQIGEIKKELHAEPQKRLEPLPTIEPVVNTQHSDSPLVQELNTKIAQLELQVDSMRQVPQNFPGTNGFQNGGTPSLGQGEEQDGKIIQKFSLSLSDSLKNNKTVETTIPAGAFAKTVLLSGLDASSAMNASSDPRPMLLRIIDYGTLPRWFQSDLKDCHCTAGAYGDLSSERVYARLEKLTCIERATGEIIETQVAGYVAGSDGKAGIRGIVASKDGQFLARSLMGGLFAGLSNVANPQNRQAQVNPFFAQGTGAKVAGPSMGEMFTSGMASGATTALDRLSQYYIDRAEQLQPVIQIAAGQVVDIVFTEGTSLRNQCCSDAVLQKSKNNQPLTDQGKDIQ